MSFENINYIAQTIGVLAILGSLVFVGIQVRQNTEQARRAHRLAVSDKQMQHQDRIISLWQLAMNDARLAVPITQGHGGVVVQVDAETAARIGAWSGAYTYAVRSWYADYLAGLIPVEALDIVEAEFCGLMTMPAFQTSWRYFKHNRFSQASASVDAQWIQRIERKLAALAERHGGAPQETPLDAGPLTQSLRASAPGDAVEQSPRAQSLAPVRQSEPVGQSPSVRRGARAVTLENINYIAQTIGVVALLVSLVFVGIQVRQNSAQIEANTRSIKAQAGFEATHSWAESNEQSAMAPEEFMKLNRRTQEPTAKLSDFSETEQARLLLSRRALFQKLEGQYFLYKYGSLDAVLWETRRDWAAGSIKYPVWAQWWEYEKIQYVWSPEFIAAIEVARDATTFEPWAPLDTVPGAGRKTARQDGEAMTLAEVSNLAQAVDATTPPAP